MGERLNHTIERVKQNGRKVAALAAIGGVSLLAAGCGGGDGMPKQEAEKYATKDYELTWKKATSPVDKYLMQYVAVTQIDILDKNGGDSHPNENLYHRFVYGNGCLQNTAYDIAGGRIQGSFSGLLVSGSIHGRMPSAAANAYVNSDKPNVLVIESGHANSRDLYFSGVDDGSDHLTPLGQQTKDELKTYGCVPAGHPEYSLVSSWTGRTSDFIVRTQGDQARPSRPDPAS